MTRWIGILTVIAAGLSGCGGSGSVNPPDGRIRALNMVSTQPSVSFLRVERTEGTLAYKQSTGLLLADEDTYNFNLEVTAPGAIDPTRVATFRETIVADRDYTFVITEPTPNNFVVVTLDRDSSAAPAGQTAIDLLHLAGAFGNVDIYIEAPAAPLAGATPFVAGATAFGAVQQGTRAAGDYVISLTQPTDPTAVLFTSTTFSLVDGDRILVALADGAGTITANVSALLLSSSNASAEVFDVSVPSELRLIHAASLAGPVDVIIDDDFALPLHSAVAADSVTAYVGLASGTRNLKIIQAGDPSSIELDQDIPVGVARRLSVLITGDLGAIVGAQDVDDLQVFPGVAKLRLISAATLQGTFNLYIVPPGTDITTATPVVANFPIGLSGYLQFLPDSYEVIFTAVGTTDVIGTPVPITLDGSGLYGIVILDDPVNGLRAQLIDDFAP